MTKRFLMMLLGGVICGSGSVAADVTDWRQFRGDDCRNVVESATAPVEWSADKNVDWRVSMPGRAVNGVIVVEGRVIATSSSGVEQDRLHVWCLDDRSGQVLWKRNFRATGRTATHPLSSIAAPTPASDGKCLYCLFASNDLICLDLAGNVRWIRALGLEYPSAFDDRGLASSPILVDGTLVVQVACQGDSFVLGIDPESGRDRWHHPLAQTTAWTSPTAATLGGSLRVLVQSADQLQVIEPISGLVESTHKAEGNLIPSPCAEGDRVFLPARGLECLQFTAGESQPSTVWQETRLGPSSGSPLAAEGRIYLIRGANVLTCGNGEDGSTLWQLRLQGSRMWATPLLVGKHLYAVNVEGLVQVVDISADEGKVIAENDLGEETLGSPAYANGSLYWRTVGSIIKVSQGDG